MTARISFEYELQQLKDNLTEMGQLIETAIEKTLEAFETQNEELAREIIQGDRNINDIEKAIESRCLSLILKQQPVARDLRIVTTALKVVTDMERIGDHAADIAELILREKRQHVYNLVKHIPEMGTVAKNMVHDAVNAFINIDIEEAREIIKRDDKVDELFDKVKEEVANLLRTSNEHVDQCVDILMIAKYFERIGDHAVNICEWTEFHETGSVNNIRIL
ncbi:phosphate signaling complex protein PhoU [Lachnospiraceae bacterium MD1]|jgi:phosphate transport system protein|uniref:Phosphate-specific transport system accessory protein PhoU n=1 Tax=Variimorphobacter saccharofermentans TaxID=2755051 RepID=A0A839K6P6_9FIRM|nr:phosphate signaling complex protein PhoU [Variimorphobacter saccharofermentans]MBB2184759.1 phosphate signaling complex protein PhoU [Variimorphobacter saccharofermentans]